MSLKNFEDRVEWMLKAEGFSLDVEPIPENYRVNLCERSAMAVFENFKENEKRIHGHILTPAEELESKIYFLGRLRKTMV